MHPIQTRGVVAERLREEGQQDTSDSQSCSVFTRCSQLLIRERYMELKDPDCTRLAGKAISQLRKQNEGEKEKEREREKLPRQFLSRQRPPKLHFLIILQESLDGDLRVLFQQGLCSPLKCPSSSAKSSVPCLFPHSQGKGSSPPTPQQMLWVPASNPHPHSIPVP